MVYIDVIPGAVGCFTSFYAIPCKYIPVKVHFGDNVRIELLYLYYPYHSYYVIWTNYLPASSIHNVIHAASHQPSVWVLLQIGDTPRPVRFSHEWTNWHIFLDDFTSTWLRLRIPQMSFIWFAGYRKQTKTIWPLNPYVFKRPSS